MRVSCFGAAEYLDARLRRVAYVQREAEFRLRPLYAVKGLFAADARLGDVDLVFHAALDCVSRPLT